MVLLNRCSRQAENNYQTKALDPKITHHPVVTLRLSLEQVRETPLLSFTQRLHLLGALKCRVIFQWHSHLKMTFTASFAVFMLIYDDHKGYVTFPNTEKRWLCNMSLISKPIWMHLICQLFHITKLHTAFSKPSDDFSEMLIIAFISLVKP